MVLLQEYIGVTAALGAAVFFSMSRILVRLGLKAGYVEQAHFISVLMNNLILWPMAAFYTYSTNTFPNPSSLMIFLTAGLFATGLGRFLTFSTLKRLTATESTPFVSISPLFASLIAVFFMGEALTINLLIGIILVTSGLLMVSKIQENAKRLAFFVGIVASFFYSVGEVLRKYGTSITPNPPIGAAIGSLAALIFIPFYKSNKTTNFRINRFFYLSGLSTSIALLLVFISYATAPLIVAVPLINTAPVFTLFLGYLIARRSEEFGLRIIVGVLMVMSGVIFIVT
jgi:drug/metabolite transporter (DMT)-like permease